VKLVYLALGEELGGGSAGFTHTKSICEALAKKGVSVTLFIKPGKGKVKKVKIVETELARLAHNPIKEFSEIKRLKKYINEADIVHERYSINPSSISLLKGFSGKHVLEVNDPGTKTWTGKRKILYAPLIRRKLRKTNAIITQTRTLKKILSAQSPKKIYVVSNGVSNSDFRIGKSKVEEERKRFSKHGEKIVCFVGSFREWHGVLEIPKIAERVAEKHSVKFVLVGAGKELEKVRKKVEGLGLEKKVRFLGSIEQEKIPVVLKASDVCIAPFSTTRFKQLEKHGFWWSPLKLFEYMAAGKATIASRFREVENILGDSAVYCEAGNPDEFAEKISLVLNNKKKREKMEKTALKRAKENDWSKKAEESIDIYNKISRGKK